MNDDIMKIIRACTSVHLSTNGADGYPETRHITNAMNRDAFAAPLYFMTGRTTPKYAQLSQDARCSLYYFDDATRHALRLFGVIEFVADAATRNKYWRDEYEKFGYGGPDGENFILMRFVPKKYKYYVGADMKTGEV